MGMPFDLIWLSLPIYLVLQVVALMRFSGVPRWGAVLPLFVMVPVFAASLFNMARASNLWPLPILFASPLAMLYVVAIIIQAQVHRQQRKTTVEGRPLTERLRESVGRGLTKDLPKGDDLH
jgi:hypothetical protein